MRIDIITVLPELLESPFSHSILKRPKEKGLLEIHLHNLRYDISYKDGRVDDYQFVGGAVIVMIAEPLAICIEALCEKRNYDEVIFLTPDGKTLNKQKANYLSLKQSLLLICGHYRGIDE